MNKPIPGNVPPTILRRAATRMGAPLTSSAVRAKFMAEQHDETNPL
jgi:hypothetical protein